jgi:hypothetical protein
MRYHKILMIRTRRFLAPIVEICNVTWLPEALELPPHPVYIK